MFHDARGHRWSLTPRGQQQALEAIGAVDVARLEAEISRTPGNLFANARHTVIDPAFAPAKWTPSIARLLERHPFETNVFLMTRFPAESTKEPLLDPVRAVVPVMREALRMHGLTLHLASDRQLDDDVLGNVAAHMWACQFGVGVLEDRLGRGLNYNVMTEIGGMLITGRRCALLKDITAPALPSDITGLIYKTVDLTEVQSVELNCHLWAADDLGFGRCGACS